jgi:hypothetical protein
VPKSFVETSDSVKVLEARKEITNKEKTLTLKLVTEDAIQLPTISFNAESMVDQITMTRVLMLGLAAQVNHGYQNMLRLDPNSELPEKDGLREEEKITNGDLLPPTTSGIITMVPELFVRILDMVREQEPIPETKTTDVTSIPKPVIEDAMLEIPTFSNAESMVDQTTRTTLLKHM